MASQHISVRLKVGANFLSTWLVRLHLVSNPTELFRLEWFVSLRVFVNGLIFAHCNYKDGVVAAGRRRFMYDPTMHARSLARHFLPGDFIADPTLLEEPDRRAVVDQAVQIGANGFATVTFLESTLRGKTIHQVTDIAQLLVLRHVSKNIRRLTGVKQENRQFIIECIRTMLREGTSYRVYKFDIKSFYESANIDQILERLRNDEGFSGQSAVALDTFFTFAKAAGVSGLPRGIGLSAILAEYLLRPFDQHIAEMSHVWFYARFVDDIFIVTSGREDGGTFVRHATASLPDGLLFNRKSEIYDFEKFSKNQTGLAHAIDFLGYRFNVSRPLRSSEKGVMRTVTLDIAPAKVRKLKTRIVKSLLRFSTDANYDDLRARFRLITGNFNFVDRATNIRRVSGIYFNYPLVDLESSTAIPDLDKFLRNMVMSPHPGNKLRPVLATALRRELARLTFRDGHAKKRFYSFRPERLVELTSVWQHA
ncbi:antiviral reverse transcriptase Drt3a [Novosphingobium sp. KACC 22771]|uniref:antiviral reverse transcriptase Drt3a n=1 Tax=Novosphingobium sp. KACC 22771 TaxID=3025670 RepID=UPI0023669AAE|nr:antiviral reverse transcriptase Drt3a [Novosphingobium sp. KACC 22771]WDF73612.1 RNA-directed DNA polymerase [Novosphingobium sp. KACC 22771]